ncbi:LRR receptor-like serine/threonine-protein kinase GSO2-like [Planoprotostelium fungivorum]|uniref:LRR receptor-like serine/threonine-protein kinase GSO2-like n=1 Tax=Planoprotostelium fungivorum TaxID=1890364 RepID=A0A2P6N8V3_9EUKA|nr:LRR receptor-like serine/threonine-protein kinase GSO2-like [Planoprotostelium fungivorum]
MRASLFVLFLSVASAALIFQVEPKSRECFYADLQSGQTSHISYFVLRGGLLDIDMTLSGPNAEVIKTGIVFEAGDSTFQATTTGTYMLCWNNEMARCAHSISSSITDSGRWTAKVVQFEWDIGVEKEDNALKADHLTPMDQTVERISDSIDAIQIDQTYLKIREQSHRDTAESTNERVLWFSILESIVLASISIGQVVMLRRFFEHLYCFSVSANDRHSHPWSRLLFLKNGALIFLNLGLDLGRSQKLNAAFSWFNIFFTSCLFVSVLKGCEATDVSITMKDIWKTLGGSPLLWQGSDVCNSTDFVGVTCDDSQNWPILIYLREENLRGTIPSSLSSLINLTHIDLSSNSLTGSIPDISRLTSLQSLYLSDNQLSGSIPSSIGNLTALLYLYISGNQLNLSGNQLCGSIPLVDFTLSLTQFDIHSNRLTGTIPQELINLSGLYILDLSSNQLNGLVPSRNSSLSLYQPCTLLATSSPPLDTLKCPLSNVSPLCISSAFCPLAQTMRGIWKSLGGPLGYWVGRNFVYNGGNGTLNGTIPSVIGQLTNLTRVNLSNNMLGGVIPDAICNMSQLISLDLSVNRLNGSIPSCMGGISLLNVLNLASNQLNGTVSPDLINLSHLSILNLSGNQLVGSVSPRDTNLPALQNLNLKNNQLTLIGYINVTGSCDLTGNQIPCSPRLNVSTICNFDSVYVTCQASTSAVQSTTSTTSASSTSLSSSAETTSPMTIVDALFANNTVISSGQAQSILNSTLQSNVETTKVISAVVLALLCNTSSFNYSTPTVSIQLQGLGV